MRHPIFRQRRAMSHGGVKACARPPAAGRTPAKRGRPMINWTEAPQPDPRRPARETGGGAETMEISGYEPRRAAGALDEPGGPRKRRDAGNQVRAGLARVPRAASGRVRRGQRDRRPRPRRRGRHAAGPPRSEQPDAENADPFVVRGPPRSADGQPSFTPRSTRGNRAHGRTSSSSCGCRKPPRTR